MSNPVGAVAALLSGRLTSASYAAGWAVVRGLPDGVAVALFDAGADLAWRRGGPGVDRLRANLARVAPEADLDALARAALRSYARYWREVFRLPGLSPEAVAAATQTTGREILDDGLRAGRGVVLALPHLGNWDTAAVWLLAQGVPFTTVAERLRPEALFDRFVAFREGLGMEVLALTGGQRPPFDVLAERLGSGGVLALLSDRDLTPRGIEVDLFGARTRLPAGPAALALRTGAALIPTTLAFRPQGWAIRFHEPVVPTDVARMTQGMADAFAVGIAAHPQDWHMLQRLWLDDLDPADPRRASTGPA